MSPKPGERQRLAAWRAEIARRPSASMRFGEHAYSFRLPIFWVSTNISNPLRNTQGISLGVAHFWAIVVNAAGAWNSGLICSKNG
jgi:hypothetical protein